ncbi:putative P450 monooxygenase [Ilyonectria sp. MPI-CAGE-AT-0026]|nr:putative P450 monooxygenase [Ilyonectria sp. MPI-CAGE-AT-0026]
MSFLQHVGAQHGKYLTPQNVLLFSIILIALLGLRIRYRQGIRDVPGPFLASFSAIDRLRSAASGRQFQIHQQYHKKYGPLVRLGPNHVSVADARYIAKIYGITSKFYKSDFYSVFDVSTSHDTVPTIFSIRNERAHSAMKRPVAHAFAVTSLLELEPMADECTRILEEKFDKMQGKPFDLGVWLQWYAFDIISSITFSNRFDFMSKETDVAGIINAIEGRLLYNSVIGQVPSVHKYLLGNKILAKLAMIIPVVSRLGSGTYIAEFAKMQMDRYSSLDSSKTQHRDMLARFKWTRDSQPTAIADAEVHSHITSNILAGSDTTAISLRSLLYYLCKNLRCMNILLDEIDGADRRDELSTLITFAEGNRLKHFQACLKEARRMHPAVGFLLERVVPKGDADFGDIHLSAGTVVGINPWVLAYDTDIYGQDANDFRPERWLEADSEFYKLMDRSFFAFGSGARTCLGKNISLMEMSKLVPQLLRSYTFKLADSNSSWKLHDFWFVRQSNMIFKRL